MDWTSTDKRRTIQPGASLLLLMSLVLAIIAVSLVAGFAAGGKLRRFERLPIHWWGVALAGLVLQWLPVHDASQAVAALVASYVLLLAFTWVNRRLVAAPLLLIGLSLNLLVVAPNAGMPVSAAAVRSLGATANLPMAGAVGKHHLQTSEDMFGVLGDTIPVPKPFGVVLSIGDVFLYAGVAVFVVSVMLGRPGVNRRPPSHLVQMYRGKHLHQGRRPARSRDRQEPVPAAAGQWGT